MKKLSLLHSTVSPLGLTLVHPTNLSEETVLNLTATAALELLLYLLPILAILVDQSDQFEIFLQGPLGLYQFGLQVIEVVLLQLLLGLFLYRKRATLEDICYDLPVLAMQLHQAHKALVLRLGPAYFAQVG